jgi:predicted nuclease of predicted toxin-antitoxin system
MRFLVDENLPAQVVSVLRELDHHVTYVRETDLRGRPDNNLIAHCNEHDLLLITQDLGIQPNLLETGLVLLRVRRQRSEDMATHVKEVIGKRIEAELRGAITVIEPARIRMRQLGDA